MSFHNRNKNLARSQNNYRANFPHDRNKDLARSQKNYRANFPHEGLCKLKEKDCGITEYVSKHEGFNGIIKQLFSDFHVNEIDCDDNVVSLTNIVPPVIKVETCSNSEHEETLKSMTCGDVYERIKLLIEMNHENKASVDIEVTERSKDERKVLHTAIRAVGSGKLISNTEEKDGKKFIVITNNKNKEKRDTRGKWHVNFGGDYLHFVVHKENLDTMECVNLLASKLRMKANMISYAGTKDRRGKTTQVMSVWRVKPQQLAQLNGQLRGVTLGNYAFKRRGLKLGDLQGNRFRIVLRNVTGSEDQIKEAMTSISENGFLNYYGLQRFGSTFSVPTSEIGKALLQGNWKLAVELILKPRDGETIPDLAIARRIWWNTRDAKEALKVLRHKEKLIEGKLLLGLSIHKPNDYVNALEKIPRNTRLLYLHSYQSAVWNKVVSRRIKEFGLKPLAGDLVYVDKCQKDSMDKGVEDSVALHGDSNDSVALHGDSNNSATDDKASAPVKKNIVKVLSESELNDVNIHDIVMPLPGHDVVYPENVMKEWYEELLKLDGFTSATLKQTVRKYSVSGAYRKVVIRPSKVSWKIMRYSYPKKILELSDFEIMNNVLPPSDEPDGKYKALVLDFCLPSSAYATMALREILKVDTSAEHQASLNSYHIKTGKNKPTTANEKQDDASIDKDSAVLAEDSGDLTKKPDDASNEPNSVVQPEDSGELTKQNESLVDSQCRDSDNSLGVSTESTVEASEADESHGLSEKTLEMEVTEVVSNSKLSKVNEPVEPLVLSEDSRSCEKRKEQDENEVSRKKIKLDVI